MNHNGKPSKDYLDRVGKILDKMNQLNGTDPSRKNSNQPNNPDGTGMNLNGFDQLGMSSYEYVQKIQREKYGNDNNR